MSTRKIRSILLVFAGLNILATTKGFHVLPATGDGEAPADSVGKGKARYSVRKTGTAADEDMKRKTADLKDPDNIKTEVTYDEKDGTYTIGTVLDGRGGTQAKASAGNANAAKTTPATGSQPAMTASLATSYLTAPRLMTPEEYRQWTLKQSMAEDWRQKNA